MTITLALIAQSLNAKLIGDGHKTTTRLAHPADILAPDDLILAIDKKLHPMLANIKNHAVIVGAGAEINPDDFAACIIVPAPRLAMSILTNLFARPVTLPIGIHKTAVIEEGAVIGKNVAIGALAYIGAGSVIEDNCQIHAQTYIGEKAKIGTGSILFAGVKIQHHVKIGARAIIHSGTVIGSDGFSFVTPETGSVESAKSNGAITGTNTALHRIASLGSVTIGDDVEIGANTSIDRGTIMDTKIGSGTKIDNQVQIGHNVRIGENCLVCGRVGIAGSAEIGNRVVLGGAVGIADHVSIGDDAIAMALSGIGGNVPAKTIVGGIPAKPRDVFVENLGQIARLGQTMRKITALEARMKELEDNK